MSIVNFDLLTEDTLQRALDSQLVPPELLAGASLRLCARLRSELQSVKYIAEMQEEELQKYQSAATPQASPRVVPVVPSTNSDSGQWVGLRLVQCTLLTDITAVNTPLNNTLVNTLS